MSNDPKDAVVDISKLMGGQSSSGSEIIVPSSMITSCNEGALIGHENFTLDDKKSTDKPD